jgi:3-hydroxypropanoate dehydrogenase
VTMMERIEKMRVSDDALDLVFQKARTYNAWLPKPVPEELLRQLYDTLKWKPTSANISPARFLFVRSTAAKERLRPSLAPGNVEKTMAAPVTVIIAYDLKFYDKVPRLFPHYPAMRDMFVKNPQLIQETALRNSTLQGAYMILAARSLGLDCGPMSGFDNAKLDEEFFAAGKCESCEQEFFPEGHVKSNFLCNIALFSLIPSAISPMESDFLATTARKIRDPHLRRNLGPKSRRIRDPGRSIFASDSHQGLGFLGQDGTVNHSHEKFRQRRSTWQKPSAVETWEWTATLWQRAKRTRTSCSRPRNMRVRPTT